MLQVLPHVELLADTWTLAGAVTVKLPGDPVRLEPLMLKLTEAPGVVTEAGGAFNVPDTAWFTVVAPPPAIETLPEIVPTVPVPAKRT